MKDKLQTKHEETIFTATSIEEMKGLFTAKRLLRTWYEDFVDEDTGETVSIERNEIILDKGALLDNVTLQTVNFYLSSGDIKEVLVSNQQRLGLFSDEYYTSTWCVTAVINDKKKNIYLYSNSVHIALDIAKDFIEQTYPGRFGIASVKELNNATLITSVSQENDGEMKFYRIEVEIEKDETTQNAEFIIKGMDAENAKALIEAYLKMKFEKDNDFEEFNLTLLSAKVIPCEAVIDADFCLKYLKPEE